MQAAASELLSHSRGQPRSSAIEATARMKKLEKSGADASEPASDEDEDAAVPSESESEDDYAYVKE